MTIGYSKPDPQAELREAQRIQTSYRVGLWTGIIFSLIAIISTISTIQTRLFAFGGITVVVIIAISGFIDAYLSSHGKASLGSGMLVTAILLFSLTLPVWAKGQGLPLAVLVIIVVSSIASNTLQRPWIMRAVIGSIVIGIIVIITDLFIPNFGIPNDPAVTNVIALVASIIYLVALLRQFNAFPLRTKLILSFLAIAMLGIAAVAIATVFILQSELERQVGTSLHAQAGIQARMIGNDLATQIDLLEVLSLSEKIEQNLDKAEEHYAEYNGDRAAIELDLKGLDRVWRVADARNDNNNALVETILGNPLASELLSFQKNHPDHVSIFITDMYGALVASTDRPADYYQADETWWQTTYNDGKGSIHFSQPGFNENSTIYAYNIAVPIFNNETGKLIGILRTAYRISGLVQTLSSSRFGESGDSVLIFTDRNYLESRGGRGTFDVDTFNQIKGIGSGYVQMVYRATSKIMAQTPIVSMSSPENNETINSLGWTLLVFQDTDEALKPIEAVRQTTLLAGLGTLIIVALIAILAGQYLSTPILSLTATAEQIRSGNLSARTQVKRSDEIGSLAETLNAMTGQLQETLGGLEKRVEERTSELQASISQSEQRTLQLQIIAEISSIITKEQNLERLLPLITDIVSDRFDYYHTGIFLIDETKHFAVLQASNSQGGQQMLDSGHKLELGTTSMVGYAALTGKARIALDVGEDAVFFDNPYLPNTRSEMALPLNVRGGVIGVLDLQSKQPSAFTEGDISTLIILADQIAIAIENARLIRQTQTALEDARSVFQSYLKQEWAALTSQKKNSAYLHTTTGGRVLESPMVSEEIDQVVRKGGVVRKDKTSTNLDKPVLAVPIRLGEQIVGAIRIQSPTKGHEWSADEVNVVKAISERVGLALENARLVENSQKRASKERVIGEISTKISAAANMDSILSTAVQELGRVLASSDVIIQFTEEDGQGVSPNGHGK